MQRDDSRRGLVRDDSLGMAQAPAFAQGRPRADVLADWERVREEAAGEYRKSSGAAAAIPSGQA